MQDWWYPRGWDIGPTFDGPLSQAQLDALFHGHSAKGNLYAYIQTLAAGACVIARLKCTEIENQFQLDWRFIEQFCSCFCLPLGNDTIDFPVMSSKPKGGISRIGPASGPATGGGGTNSCRHANLSLPPSSRRRAAKKKIISRIWRNRQPSNGSPSKRQKTNSDIKIMARWHQTNNKT